MKNAKVPAYAHDTPGISGLVGGSAVGTAHCMMTDTHGTSRPCAHSCARLVLAFALCWVVAPVAHGQVVVNEIFYKDASYNSTPSGDWFELFNQSNAPVSLNGYVVSDKGGTLFTNFAGVSMPAHGYLVVCKDTAMFHAAHPAVTNYIGPSGISLGSNDSVLVYNQYGQLIDEVKYECGADGWPYAYGNERSLELVQPFEEEIWLPCFWRTSTALGGSPGARNPNSVGLYVTTHNRTPDGPRSYEQPFVKIEAADIYGSVTSATIKVDWGSGVFAPAAMTPEPGDFYTFLPPTNDGRIVRYFFVLRDNAGQICERWWRGTNEPYMYRVYDNPLTNGLVINEIMYNSSNVWNGHGYEYIEIVNTTNVPVDVSYWLIKDETYNNLYDKLRLPALPVLSGGWYLVLANRTQAITDVYGPLPTNALMAELHDMNLDNGGQDIRWQNINGQAVDDVNYNDKLPWPTAPDGNGPSLELRDPSLDNSLASSWTASEDFGTPGRPNNMPEPAVASLCLAACLARRLFIERR